MGAPYPRHPTLGFVEKRAHNISTAYHPQTDGQSERTNQCLKQYIRIFIDYHQNDWDRWLPLAQYTLNATPHAITRKAPFELIMGHIPHVHQTKRTTKSPPLNDQLETINNTRKEAIDALRRAQTLSLPSKFIPYCVGDRVWLEAKHLNTTHPTAKLTPRRHGPFLITAAISHVSYRLKLPSTWKVHNVFHASLLTPYKETTTNRTQYQEPAPDLVNGQPEWEVEQILGARRRRNQLQYLIRWKNFSEAHDSWEPLTHINADHLIAEFYKQQPLAACSINYKDPPLFTNNHYPTNKHVKHFHSRIPHQPPPNHLFTRSHNHSTAPFPPYDTFPRYAEVTNTSDRISDAPGALTLAERIDNPPETLSRDTETPPLAYPIIPYLDNDGLASRTHSEHGSDTDAEAIVDNIPEGFVLYNRELANHVRYG